MAPLPKSSTDRSLCHLPVKNWGIHRTLAGAFYSKMGEWIMEINGPWWSPMFNYCPHILTFIRLAALCPKQVLAYYSWRYRQLNDFSFGGCDHKCPNDVHLIFGFTLNPYQCMSIVCPESLNHLEGKLPLFPQPILLTFHCRLPFLALFVKCDLYSESDHQTQYSAISLASDERAFISSVLILGFWAWNRWRDWDLGQTSKKQLSKFTTAVKSV